MRLTIDSDTVLRSVEAEDAESLFLAVDGNRAHLGPWLPWVELTLSINEIRVFIESSIEREESETGIASIIDWKSEILGVVGLDSVDLTNQSARIGYWLREDAQGRGVVTRAVHCLSEYAFATLGLNRLTLYAAPENLRSRAVAQRLGFREEGILRQAEKHGDHFRDLVCYSLLRCERQGGEAPR